MRQSRHRGGTSLWTTQRHFKTEVEQRRAGKIYADWAEPHERAYTRRLNRAEAQQAHHTASIDALLLRQKALIRPAVEFVYHAAGASPRVEDGDRIPRYAMGVPLFVGEKLWAVICPVATRLTPTLVEWFSTATIVVADEQERKRIAEHTREGQRFKVLEPGPAGSSVGIREAMSRPFSGVS